VTVVFGQNGISFSSAFGLRPKMKNAYPCVADQSQNSVCHYQFYSHTYYDNVTLGQHAPRAGHGNMCRGYFDPAYRSAFYDARHAGMHAAENSHVNNSWRHAARHLLFLESY